MRLRAVVGEDGIAPALPVVPCVERVGEGALGVEYALGNLATNKVYAWTPEDYKVSELMQSYFANFIRKGDPNGAGLPLWPASKNGSPVQIMRLDVQPRAVADEHRARYLFLDRL